MDRCYKHPHNPPRCIPVTEDARRKTIGDAIIEKFPDVHVDEGLCGDIAHVLQELFPAAFVCANEPQPRGLGEDFPMHTWVIDKVTLLSHDLQNPYGVRVWGMRYWRTCGSCAPTFEDVQNDNSGLLEHLLSGLGHENRVCAAFAGCDCAGCDICGTHCVPGCSSGDGEECTARQQHQRGGCMSKNIDVDALLHILEEEVTGDDLEQLSADLDEHVHEWHAAQASRINNCGHEDQIRYLIGEGCEKRQLLAMSPVLARALGDAE